MSRVPVPAALCALKRSGPELGPAFSPPAGTNPESQLYQIGEGTKALINVLTGPVLDRGASLPLKLLVKHAPEQTEGLVVAGVSFPVPVAAAAHAFVSLPVDL